MYNNIKKYSPVLYFSQHVYEMPVNYYIHRKHIIQI